MDSVEHDEASTSSGDGARSHSFAHESEQLFAGGSSIGHRKLIVERHLLTEHAVPRVLAEPALEEVMADAKHDVRSRPHAGSVAERDDPFESARHHHRLGLAPAPAVRVSAGHLHEAGGEHVQHGQPGIGVVDCESQQRSVHLVPLVVVGRPVPAGGVGQRFER